MSYSYEPMDLQANSLPAEPQGKPKNTGVGRLSLLQRIFPTQESNQGVLHCRCILYQLSYQGSPLVEIMIKYKPVGGILLPFFFIYIYTHTHTYTHTHVCYMYMYVYYVYVYLYIYTHTHCAKQRVES